MATVACSANGNPATAPCNDGVAVGSCLDSKWIYCDCGGTPGPTPAAFVKQTTAGVYQFTAVVDPTWATLSLNLSTHGCWGTQAATCRVDQGACSPQTNWAWTWLEFAGTPATPVTFTVWKDDGGSPCSASGGGSVAFTATLVLP